MAIKTARWTRHDLERFPRDGNRYEVLDGELLVTPQASPDHQVVAGRLFVALYSYCESHRAGLAVGPGAVIFGKNELQPDIEVFGRDSYRPGKKWNELPFPILVVEMLSPFAVSRRRDLDTKREAYLRLGIPEYWVVDLDGRCVHVWSSGKNETIISDTLRWTPIRAALSFELALDRLFASTDSAD